LINNIGDVISILLEDFDLHKNKEIELTGVENLDFYSVAEIMSSEINDNIEFVNVNPLKFFRIIKQDGLNSGLIIVMTMLHFLPRLQSDPTISNNYETLIGHKPTTLKEFVYRDNVNRAAGQRAVVMVYATPLRQFYRDVTTSYHLPGLNHMDNFIMT
jgi:hypothetical protein